RLAREWPALVSLGVVAAIVVWLGTPLLFYMYVAPPMSHATSAFAVALFVTVWMGVPARGAARRPVLLRGRGAGAGVAAAAVAFLPQALAYVALNGHVGPSRLVARKMSWQAPHALEVVASPAPGLIFWPPLAAVAVIGLVVLAMRFPPPMRALGIGLLC